MKFFKSYLKKQSKTFSNSFTSKSLHKQQTSAQPASDCSEGFINNLYLPINTPTHTPTPPAPVSQCDLEAVWIVVYGHNNGNALDFLTGQHQLNEGMAKNEQPAMN